MVERESLLLNGVWDHGDVVPTYSGIVVEEKKRYQRTVRVPENWVGKRISLYFGMANFTTEIMVNQQLVGRHIGGWVPFEVDITPYVKPGEMFTLTVDVYGRNVPPYVNEEGLAVWPYGSEYEAHQYNIHYGYAGLCDNVRLLARGEVTLRSTFIKTSCSSRCIEVEYVLENTTEKKVRAVVHAAVRDECNEAELEVELDAGEKLPCKLTIPQGSLRPWWPDAPTLYFLDSSLSVEGTVIDSEGIRFGFREITLQDKRIFLNGIRFNIVSDYCVFRREKHWGLPVLQEGGMRQTYRRLKNVGVNMVRWHKMPVPEYVLDLADEEGMCIEAESAVGTLGDGGKYDYEQLMDNFKQWIGEWVVGCRNHPSIIIWSAANEPIAPHKYYTDLGKRFFSQFDPTRPVLFEFASVDHVPDDADIDIYVYHYPRPGHKDPRMKNFGNGLSQPWNRTANMYEAWDELLRDDIPISMGEGLHSNCGGTGNYDQKRNEWWQGVWTRALRYNDWAIIGPASFRWVRYVYEQNPLKLKNLRCAYARVALFDKAYDALGVTPYITGLAEGGKYPTLEAGTHEKRTLVLYNDEFRDTQVAFEVEINIDGATYAIARGEKQVELGEHIEFDYEFDVPNLPSRTLKLILRTSKGSRKTFEETKCFIILGEDTPPEVQQIRFS